ncbi:MAG: c-type cytochrome [Gemmatimonadota bacterium]|nr:c-type cytochrome [Gemmatimonadota bacterium]MDE3215099.1 c-type cytochrome [Gemmatimonadota bacterium]
MYSLISLAAGLALAGNGPAARAAPPDTTFPPAVVALGDSVFHGRAGGGICFTCHGPNAKGTPGLAPDLTDARWLHGDGSYAFLVRTVTTGVPKPREAAAPMPPKGGATLSDLQVRAVAAYVYSLRLAR